MVIDGARLTENDPGRVIDDLVAAARSGPTAVDAELGLLYVLRYHEVDRLAHDRRMAGVGLTMFDLMGIKGPLRDWYSELMFTNEGEDHARMRRLVSRAFTPRSVEQLRDYSRGLADATFTRMEEYGGGDLVDSFSLLGTRVMCRLLGVPAEDVEIFAGWSDALSRTFGIMDAGQIEQAGDALEGMLDYTAELVGRRGSRTRRDADSEDDLISALLRAEDQGDRLTRHEVVTMVSNLLVAAHDTTASQLSCSLLTLLRHPESLPPIRNGEVPPGDVVTETMRFEPAIPAFPRTALEPIEIAGVERPAGTLVMLAVGSANRDPEVYADPDRFDVRRFSSPDIPRPLSFGTGPHFCLGSNLARMIMEEVIARFAASDLRLDGDPDRVEWRSVLGRGPVSLPCQYGHS
ncbi:MAG TPA: cytochrome P450 [Acidimicrobiales bacterium]|nr:cytochrome P450 [Acidimicrobiales bacterium]